MTHSRYRHGRLWRRGLAITAIVAFLGCTFSEPRIRSEPILFFPANPTPTNTPGAALFREPPLHCVERAPFLKRTVLAKISGSLSGGTSTLDECIYNTVDAQGLLNILKQEHDQPDAQNQTLTSMLMMSDQNCDNFRSRVFAFRANSGYLGSITGALLASGGAITALVSGPVAAGLSGASAAVIASISGVNSNFYSNYGMGELDQKIVTSRTAMADCIQKRMDAAVSKKPPGIGDPECKIRTVYSAEERMSDLQQYDSRCSLELAAASPMPTPTATPPRGQ